MKLTLGQVLALSLLGLAVTLGILFAVVLNESRAAIIESSERIRDQASSEITERVTSFLSKAPDTVSAFQQQIKLGLVNPSDPQAVESALFALLLAKSEVSEITLTHGEKIGFNEEGAIQLARVPRWQLSAVRSTDNKEGAEHFWSRYVRQEDGAFVAYRRTLQPGWNLIGPPASREVSTTVSDPTSHLTFTTPASRDFQGRLLWSDLHWSQLDANQPQEQRDIEVSVQRTVADASDKFAGVIRVGLLAEQLDRVVQLKHTPAKEPDPHRIFLSDRDGRLITRGVGSDRAKLSGEDLRIAPVDLAPEIARALAEPKLRNVDENMPVVSGNFRHNREEFLTTFRTLPGTQDWTVGIVVPRAFYLGSSILINLLMCLVSTSMHFRALSKEKPHGTIDKYIGDAIMTIWNAPEPVPDHPRMACLAALRCRDASRALAQSPEWRGLPEFETRFGLHCATALVGHFGARDRMNYTAIGDAINLASRLEGLNKQYGTSIIASESIFERAREAFDFRLLDVVAVKGKSDAITMYELLGTKGASGECREIVAAYETAFAAYAAKDFERALTILREYASDPPSAVLIERCNTSFKPRRPPDWQGVYVSLSK
jgi:class 3 adenylate cyclase